MKQFEMKAERRSELGSRPSRRLVRSGRVPAVLCGRGVDSIALHVGAKEFEDLRKKHARIVLLQLEGKSEPSVVHEIDWDPITQEARHIDFQRVNMNERIEVAVTVKTRGPAKGEKDGGIVMLQMDAVKVRCLPLEIPEQIEVDIRELGLHDSVHVKELKLPPGVAAAEDPDALVLAIVEPKKVEEPVPGAVGEAGPMEPELIVKAPKAEEGAESGEAAAAGKEKKPEKK